MNDIEHFIRSSAAARGIDPDIAVNVANSEGGVTEPARLGDFSGPPWFSGKSWWPFQLHYGGKGTPYEAWGGSAGMGNSFTALTGWQPGDPHAWRDSVRYALNQVKRGGWGPWYGAQKIGVTGFTGVNRDHPFNADAEPWDFQTGANPVAVTYNKAEPNIAQNDPWSCAPTSTRWALKALGRNPSEQWIEDTMIAEGVVSQQAGLLDATGSELAGFVRRHYGEFGYDANNEAAISWDWAVHEGGNPDGSGHQYPVLIGGRAWNHWSVLVDFDPVTGLLVLMNPAPGWMGVGQTLDKSTFDALGAWSAVRVWHPDLFATAPPQPQPEPPVPPKPSDRDVLIEVRKQLAATVAYIDAQIGA